MSTNEATDGLADPAGLSRGVTLTMAASCGLAVANIYYNQPLIAVLGRDFGGSPLVGFVPTATQLGYATGIILLVPLGDMVQRRTLIVAQIAALCIALLAMALAPNPLALLAASAAIGVTATMAQQIIPFAADLAGPTRRGAVIGTVMSGLLCGVLLGRTVAGLIGSTFGWRTVYGFSIVAAVAMAVTLANVLPRQAPKVRLPYPVLIASMWGLWRDEPRLRRASLTQTSMFASFSVFWTILALKLEEAPYHMGPAIAGLFGLLGAAGALSAPLLGRLADRRGPRFGILLGAALIIAAWVVIGVSLSMVALIVGVLILDVGLQGGMISNQHVIFALRPDAGSRINTVYIGLLFLGGAFGSAAGSVAWYHGGWTAVSLLGGLLALPALVLQLTGDEADASAHG
jgi:predicted MFS family arabinose efflux permease